MNTAEKHQFQAEIQQLLDIVIHSLYTDKEIFVRELISNAADALEKLRFLQSSGQDIHQPELPLKISVATDEKEQTITITDSGIGMNQAELVQNLGTIAHSGSRAFIKQLAEQKKPDTHLIGQFGVGFYSAFMVAEKVEVFSRSYRAGESSSLWVSQGTGGYEIVPAEDLPRGTRIVIHLKEDEKRFSRPEVIEEIIRRYSKFVSFPIELNGKAVNTVQALWSRNKSEIKEEDYHEFYKYIGHDVENPRLHLHFTADAPLAIQALLYVPMRNLERLGMSRMSSEVHLYCKKILIQNKAVGLLPEWLRFVRGVVDSEDLPLNISRETMQDSALMQKLNKVLTGRFIRFLEDVAEKNREQYAGFFDEFGRFLKEGIIADPMHAQALGKLLRFESSTVTAPEKTSLAEYVTRMKPDQSEIFFLHAANRQSAELSPYYEAFRSRGLEVLFVYDPWDEFVMEHLAEFDGKKLRPAEKASVEITEQPKEGDTLSADEAGALAGWFKEVLGEKVAAVRPSKRLVHSPALVVDSDPHMTSTMRQILSTIDRNSDIKAAARHDLEINPAHPVVYRLDKLRQKNVNLARKVAEQVFDSACVAAGVMSDPKPMLSRINELLEEVLVAKT